jgi:copper chaperone CopZ
MAAHVAAISFVLGVSTAAATSSTWSIPTDNMVCMAGASYAEMTLERVSGVGWVVADPHQRLITASIDDTETSIGAVMQALAAAGLDVGPPAKVER